LEGDRNLMGTTGLNTTTPDGKNVTADILNGIAAYLTPNNSPNLAPPPT
jgi:hypothetical protein